MCDKERDEGTLALLSWNVNGFQRKKSAVLNYIKLLQADIVFLQETHIGPKQDRTTVTMTVDHTLSPDYSWAVFTVYKASSRGVAVLIRNGLRVEGIRISEDTKGRYLVMSCTIRGRDFIFVNLYNPKDEKIDYDDLAHKLPKSGNLLITGDFNTALDEKFDKTSSVRNRAHKDTRKVLQEFLDRFSLADVWRCVYPDTKCFTFFDGSRKGKSRLDYFFVPAEILNKVRECTIHARPQHVDKLDYISDHAPISMRIQTDNTRWQFERSLLEHEQSLAHLSKTIQNFSGRSGRKKSDLWPYLKIRFGFEAIVCIRRRVEQTADQDFRQDSTFPVPMETDSFDETADHIIVLEKNRRHTGSISNVLGPPTVPQSNLESDIQNYLDKLHNTRTSEELELALNTILVDVIGKKEILSTVLSLSDSNCPRPDGLTVTFYQKFICQLIDYLQSFFNDILSNKAITSNFNESLLVAPSASNDHSYCKIQLPEKHELNCSPISVFNIDYEILTTILAERLDSVMEHILNPGQHSIGYSSQACIHDFEKAKQSGRPILVVRLKVSPGALKWTYLFQRLSCYKIPKEFQAVLKVLLQNGSDNGLRHDPSPPSSGLTIGCPLTPVLVRLCLHQLIQSLDKRLAEISGHERIRMLLDSDEAVFIITNPYQEVETFEKELSDFLTNSGFTVNEKCSEVLSVGFPVPLCLEKLAPFRRTTEGFWMYGHFIG